ncbi:MAG TPA: NAD(P)-binding protein, partial [Bacteroidales bacterium]|nr:NAD(P)-binding protein [Bacteroidales bacterium]
MKQFDVIIIGSGLGGLVCGYILSKNGYKVGIFEKNNQIGGCLQTFKRKGVSFDTGMHYIGSMEEGQILHRFF